MRKPSKPTWFSTFILILVLNCTNILTPKSAYAQNPEILCPYWAQENQPISTHMNLRGLSNLPQGLPLETLIYRHADGTWLRMEAGFYSDFLFETRIGPTRNRRDPAPYFEEAEASQTKDDLVAYLDDALRAHSAGERRDVPSQAFLVPGTASSVADASFLTRNRQRTKVHPGNTYAFWYPSGRYIARGPANFYSLPPCEAGRRRPALDASEAYAIVFQIRQGFIPFHPDSYFQTLITNTRDRIGASEPDSPLGNTYPYDPNLDPAVTYRIHHADDFVARFICRPLSSAARALPPSCEGIVLWPEEGLAVSMRFPIHKGVVQSEALYLEPVQAVYDMIQNWKEVGENDG